MNTWLKFGTIISLLGLIVSTNPPFGWGQLPCMVAIILCITLQTHLKV